MRVEYIHKYHPFGLIEIEGLVQQPLTDHSILRALKEATICGAPGRCDLSFKRARSTKELRPTFASQIGNST